MRDSEPPTPAEHHQLPARLDAVARAVSLARDFCSRHGVQAPVAERLALAVEELFSNTVRHGHGADSDRLVCIALKLDDGEVGLLYEDDAPAFDPVAAAERSARALDDATGEPRVGGLGLPLIRGVASAWSYQRAGSHNRISLRIAGGAANAERPRPARE